MKSYKKGYVEVYQNDIQAVITRVFISEENGLQEIDEEELKRFNGFDSVDEAKEFLKEFKIKEIEVQRWVLFWLQALLVLQLLQ